MIQVYGWGRGEHGRLGFGDNDKSSKMVPQKVHLLAGEDIVQVSCGGTHSAALTRDGRIFSIFCKEPFFYGHDNYDQLVKLAKCRTYCYREKKSGGEGDRHKEEHSYQ